MKRFNVIIPSAKLVGIGMQNEFGAISPGLIPLNGKVVFELILEQMARLGRFTAYIGIEEGGDLVERYFEFFPHSNIRLVRLNRSASLSDSIERVITRHPEILETPLIINLADTVVTDASKKLIGRDFVVSAVTGETERWTLFKRRGRGIGIISDKEYQPEASEWEAFVGLWGVGRPDRFMALLGAANRADVYSGFYAAVQRYFNSAKRTVFFRTKGWVDCGHVDNYYAARRRQISSRYFNSLRLLTESGTIVKTSSNAAKLVDEINWFREIPKKLRHYLPTVYDSSSDLRKPHVEMEFYSYPTLDDCYIYGRYDYDSWEKIIGKIFRMLKTAAEYTVHDARLGADLEEMYIGKTLERLNAFLDEWDEDDAELDLGDGRVRRFRLRDFPAALPDVIRSGKVCKSGGFQIIHGDLCFSNILYDQRHGIMKLVDPRGRFGRFRIHGDVHYDLAKLSHSILGLYDFIKWGQFRIERAAGGGERVIWRRTGYHEVVGDIFKKHLIMNGFSLGKVRLIEALLFLSMLPLHKDEPRHQKAMLSRALEILGPSLRRRRRA